jgi:hypothetical protein
MAVIPSQRRNLFTWLIFDIRRREMKKLKVTSALFLATTFCASAHADTESNWYSTWLENVTAIQDEQPHWVTPLATVTPRLEQEFRTDFSGQQTTSGHTAYNFGNGKGLEFIPFRPVEIILNVPPYIEHNSAQQDGFGDFSFLVKYRILSANQKEGDYILTFFFGMSVPTGTANNGSVTSVFAPTIAGGKGCGPVDVQSTFGVTLPARDTMSLGHKLLWNTTVQYHAADFVWPEIEDNYSHFSGGTNDGNTENFITPALMFGRFPLHERTGLTFGGGYQIATTHFSTYSHTGIVSLRMPF